MADWLFGGAGSLLIAYAAYRKGSLSGSGAVGAVVTGTILFALGSLVWFGLMIAFFLSSSLLTKWKKQRKAAAESVYQKSGRRDLGQVAANGGAGVAMCLLNAVWPDPLWLWAYVGVMATATADTWATEIGGLSPAQPRSILTLRKVPSGTSGGITLWGTAASGLGGLFTGLTGALLIHWDPMYGYGAFLDGPALVFITVAFLSGFLGACTDSVLGARWQAMYRCSACGKEVEGSTHCGASTVPLRGIPRMDNDVVNFLSTCAGGAIAVLLASLPEYFH